MKQNKKEQGWEVRERLSEIPFDKLETFPQDKWEGKMKQSLIVLRNGGFITPVLEEIRQFLQQAQAEGYSKGRIRCLEQHRGKELQQARAELIAEQVKKIEGLKCARDEQMSFKLGFMEARTQVLSILTPNYNECR